MSIITVHLNYWAYLFWFFDLGIYKDNIFFYLNLST